jgi:hypothetical protein
MIRSAWALVVVALTCLAMILAVAYVDARFGASLITMAVALAVGYVCAVLRDFL